VYYYYYYSTPAAAAAVGAAAAAFVWIKTMINLQVCPNSARETGT